MSPSRRGLFQLAISLGLLLTLFWVFDAAAILAHLRGLDPRWLTAALILSVLQILLLAWRWRFTAQRLGIGMPYRQALREYYLGVFLNQLLPSGILGDVSRAWRHAHASSRTREAIHAVVLERVLVQVMMVIVGAASLLAIPALWPAQAGGFVWTLLALPVGGWLLLRGLPALRRVLRAFRADLLRAFLPLRVLWIQGLTSALVVAGNLLLFLLTARAVGSETPLLVLLPLITPVLLAMMLPISIAGWGVREGAAGLLWAVSGLGAEEGVAIAVAYGLLFFLTALPGMLPLLRRPAQSPHPAGAALRGAGRDRTACPAPARSGDTADAVPDPTYPPEPASPSLARNRATTEPRSDGSDPGPRPPKIGKR